VTPPTFTETFADLTTNTPWVDGGTYGAWTDAYNGYGSAKITTDGSNVLEQAPKQSTRTSETHGGLALTTRQFNGDVDITVRQRTVQQLRLPTPNPWEVPWLLWNYTDDEHFYSVVLKPNGWEIGQATPQGQGNQRIVATGAKPRFPIGTWHSVRVAKAGQRITVWANGRQLTSFSDPASYSGGRIGLYTEDADTRFGAVRVTRPAALLAPPAA
jgi:hypothetical protein